MLSVFGGCRKDPVEIKIGTVISSDLQFKAYNLTISDKPISAIASPVTLNTTVTINIIDGDQTVSKTIETKSDVLPVRAGDVVELQYLPEKDAYKSVLFTLPDGSTVTLGDDYSTHKWIVPDDVVSGSTILGETRYQKDHISYTRWGNIELLVVDF